MQSIFIPDLFLSYPPRPSVIVCAYSMNFIYFQVTFISLFANFFWLKTFLLTIFLEASFLYSLFRCGASPLPQLYFPLIPSVRHSILPACSGSIGLFDIVSRSFILEFNCSFFPSRKGLVAASFCSSLFN